MIRKVMSDQEELEGEGPCFWAYMFLFLVFSLLLFYVGVVDCHMHDT